MVKSWSTLTKCENDNHKVLSKHQHSALYNSRIFKDISPWKFPGPLRFAYIFLHLGMDAICCNKPADITEHLQATAPAKSLPLPTEVNKAIEWSYMHVLSDHGQMWWLSASSQEQYHCSPQFSPLEHSQREVILMLIPKNLSSQQSYSLAGKCTHFS